MSSQQQDRLQIAEILASPMPSSHQQIVITHLNRLHKIIDESPSSSSGEDVIALSRRESVAKQQLDKMTRVFRSYQERQQKGELEDEEVESMMADLIDGCVLSSLTAGQWEGEGGRGRARTPRSSSSTKQAGSDCPEEEGTTTVVSKGSLMDSIGTAAQDEREHWIEHFTRPRTQSEARSARYPARRVILKDREEFTRKLCERTSDAAHGRWPLSPEDEREFYATGATRGQEGAEDLWDFINPEDER